MMYTRTATGYRPPDPLGGIQVLRRPLKKPPTLLGAPLIARLDEELTVWISHRGKSSGIRLRHQVDFRAKEASITPHHIPLAIAVGAVRLHLLAGLLS